MLDYLSLLLLVFCFSLKQLLRERDRYEIYVLEADLRAATTSLEIFGFFNKILPSKILVCSKFSVVDTDS